MSMHHGLSGLVLLAALGSIVFAAPGDDAAKVGPETEKRFPPLVVPAGFKATLFACDPLIEYPSVIALGPRQGTVFVAYDYMTGLGTEITRRDEVRLVQDTDGDGYADTSTVLADGFNSIQGLASQGDTVFVMHAPFLTVVQDTDGDGKADTRTDCLSGLGLPPEKNSSRLHCANGVTIGHDGWLYLSMGDNGTDVMRPEGDRLVFNEGGILRCRPDGSDLHVFSSGLRNIYDVALDDELNVFVRDNENDGGDYLLRVNHCFHGSDHGYPYVYNERPSEAMPSLAILGRGSSAGGVCYLETAFPPEYRGNLFFCEWGKSLVRYERKPQGSSFAPMKEIEFATGAATDPYGFKPTDVIVDRDGSLLVSDWCDGQRPKRGRGRIYRIAWANAERPEQKTAATNIDKLGAPSLHVRTEATRSMVVSGRQSLRELRTAKNLSAEGRMHAVWVMADLRNWDTLPELFKIAGADTDPRVRAQAVRAIVDLSDPLLVENRRDAAGRKAVPSQLISLPMDDPRVVREVAVALGRLQWNDTPRWLDEVLKNPDPALSHAAQQSLRRVANWPQTLDLLDLPDERPARTIALKTLANQADPAIVDGLIARLSQEPKADRRREYADLLTRVYKKPGPWTYWGYRPAPRRPNTVAWERTDAIEAALDRLLADPDRDVRKDVLRRMQREQIPARLPTLALWLEEERQADRVSAVLDSLEKLKPEETREALTGVICQSEFPLENRQTALRLYAAGIAEGDGGRLKDLAADVEDGPLMADLLRDLSRKGTDAAPPLFLAKLDSVEAIVRTAALEACEYRKLAAAADRVLVLLHDPDPQVRRAAAAAAGSIDLKAADDLLLPLAGDVEPAVRSAAVDSLRKLSDPRAVAAAVACLGNPATELAGLEYLAALGSAAETQAVLNAASRSRSVETLTAAVGAFAAWKSRRPGDSSGLEAAIAEIQGQCGLILQWQLFGPLDADKASKFAAANPTPDGRQVLATGLESVVETEPAKDGEGAYWMAAAEFTAAEATRAQLLGSSNGTLDVWLNGNLVHQRTATAAFQADSDRFEADLLQGRNRIAVKVSAVPQGARFHLRFRRISSSAEHERLARYLLQNTGDVVRGREVFMNADKSLCLKCHRLKDDGGNIGPSLTGVGDRFSKIHVVESILDPSRTIAPSYETISVALVSGRVVTGVKVSEDAAKLVLGDETGKRHEIPAGEIDERSAQRRSTMPDGLEKRISDQEFLDLLAFLLSQKKPAIR